jgi:hypothetical protein
MAELDWSRAIPADNDFRDARDIQMGVEKPKSLDWSAAIEAPEVEQKPSGLLGVGEAIWTGTKNLIEMGRATGNVISGDNAAVEAGRERNLANEANSPLEKRQFMADYMARNKRDRGTDGDVSMLDAIGNLASSAWNNKMGFTQAMAEQAPNAVPVLAMGAAGAAAGAATPIPGGAIIGGFLGMALGNAGIEIGSKAIEKAEGGLTNEESSAALREGSVKGTVIAGVDLATLGIGGKAMKAIGGTAVKAGAMAEAKVLMDAGVDVTNPMAIASRLAADKALAASAKAAGTTAARDALTLGQKAGMAATGMGLETVGEGVGEYFGEMAATGKGNMGDAVLEAFMGAGQSSVETAYNFNKVGRNELDMRNILNAGSTEEAIQHARNALAQKTTAANVTAATDFEVTGDSVINEMAGGLDALQTFNNQTISEPNAAAAVADADQFVPGAVQPVPLEYRNQQIINATPETPPGITPPPYQRGTGGAISDASLPIIGQTPATAPTPAIEGAPKVSMYDQYLAIQAKVAKGATPTAFEAALLKNPPPSPATPTLELPAGKQQAGEGQAKLIQEVQRARQMARSAPQLEQDAAQDELAPAPVTMQTTPVQAPQPVKSVPTTQTQLEQQELVPRTSVKVGGVNADLMSNEELQAIVTNPKANKNTRRAAQEVLSTRFTPQRTDIAELERQQFPDVGETTNAPQATEAPVPALQEEAQPEPGVSRTVAKRSENLERMLRENPAEDRGIMAGEVDINSLGSEVSSLKTKRMGKLKARGIKALMALFGRKVVFFEASKDTAEGIHSDKNNRTIYVNVDSEVDTLAVVNHEFSHSFEKEHPAEYAKAVAATEALLRADGTRALKYATYYNKRDWIADGAVKDENVGDLARELIGDITGNEARTGEFWGDVFNEVALQNPTEARGIITRIRDAVVKFINKVIAATPKGGFQLEGVGFTREDLKEIRDQVVQMAAKSMVKAERVRLGLEQDTAAGDGVVREAANRKQKVAVAKGAKAGFSTDNKVGVAVSASYKPGRNYGTVVYPENGGNLVRLHERMLVITRSADFDRLLESIGLKSFGAQTTIRGMWDREPEWTQVLRLKQLNGTPATFEQTRAVANLLGWATQQDAAITSMVVDKPVDGQYNIPSLYFGKEDGTPMTAAEIDTALAAFGKVTPGASVTPDGKTVKFLFFPDEKSKLSETDQQIQFGKNLQAVAVSVNLSPDYLLAFTNSSLDEFNKRTNENENRGYLGRNEGYWGKAAKGLGPRAIQGGIGGRTVDVVLVPYIAAVRAEGFGFDYDLWQQRNKATAAEVAELREKVAAYEQQNKHGLKPRLRETIDISNLPEVSIEAQITQKTNEANAENQLGILDKLKQQFPNAVESAREWLTMAAHAFGSNDVPVAPRNLINLMQDSGAGILEQLRQLTPGQIKDATSGFNNAAEFLQLYTSGKVKVETTGKLMLWSFLSRGVSPYIQEAMFVDSVRGVEPFIQQAARGEFGPAELANYIEWADGIAKSNGAGAPGNATKHNLNAFGKSFLIGMSQKAANGKTKLQHLHDMLSDKSMTGRDIRREFVRMSEGVGIDNKVMSFTLLVTGRTDVLVLDRIQMRNLFDDGSFAGYNLYDGTRNTKLVTDAKDKTKRTIHEAISQREGETDEEFDNRVDQAMRNLAKQLKIKPSAIEAERAIEPGTGLASMTTGVRGLMLYEFFEDKLLKILPDVYQKLGRPQDASPGRYHWESWVVVSGQEASHGTLDSLLYEAEGQENAFADVTVKQGEYSQKDYGVRYGRDVKGNPYYLYENSAGTQYKLTHDAWRALLKSIDRIKGRAAGFLLSRDEQGNARTQPWYFDSRIDRAKIDAELQQLGEPHDGQGTGSARRSNARSSEYDRTGSAAEGRPSYGRGREGAVQATGVHYSKAQRGELSSRFFGTGMKGEEGARISYAKDERIKNRLYFYINTGRGVVPESDVGAHAHTVDLQNLYDLDSDPLELYPRSDPTKDQRDQPLADERMNSFESKVLDAGFDGYLTRDFGTGGAVVLLGDHSVPVQYEGSGVKPDAQAFSEPVTLRGWRELQDKVTKNNSLPNGSMMGADWKRMMPKLMPELDVSHLPDERRFYKDQLVKRPEARMSNRRVVDVFKTLAKDEEAFKYPVQTSMDLGEVVKGIDPAFKVYPVGSDHWSVDEAKADEGWIIVAPDKKDGWVFRKGNDVWINVASFGSGQSRGTVVYQAVGDWVYNNGFKFLGDPAGISYFGATRRIENLISSALKHGTTEHLRPHPGNFDHVPPNDLADHSEIKWEEGAHDQNLEKLILASYAAVIDSYPEIKDVRFIPATGRFERAGTPLVDEDIQQLIADNPASAGLGKVFGVSSFKRSVLVDTVLRETGGEGRGGILGELERQLQSTGSVPGLGKVLYSNARALPNDTPVNRTLDGAKLQALRRAAADLERPKDGVYLRITEDGRAIATGPKGTRIPETFRRFARDNDLAFFAERDIGVSIYSKAPQTTKSEPMSIDYRESGALYFGEMGDAKLDRTERTRFSFKRVDTNSPEFKKWFSGSKVVDANGKPLRVYHGTRLDSPIDQFDGLNYSGWFSSAPETANTYAGGYSGEQIDEGSVYPTYLAIRNPIDLRNRGFDLNDDADIQGLIEAIPEVDMRTFKTHEGAWEVWEIINSLDFREAAEAAGFDGLIAPENRVTTYAAFFPSQIKSAISNTGAFSDTNPDIRYSTNRLIGNSGRQYTPEQEAMHQRVGRVVDEKTILERLKDYIQKRWRQGIFDQFAPFYGTQAYTLMRLSKGSTGAFEAFMKHGKLSLRDGAYDADTTGGVIENVFHPLGKETTDFLYWIAGNRAERLVAEGKERLFTNADIQAAKSLADGQLDFDYILRNGTVTRSRKAAYMDSLVKFNEFNKNVMDMAEQSGLIDGAARHLWEHEFYVPFYRVMEDENTRAMGIKKGIVRQEAFKKLKGGEEQLGDLLMNTLLNWHHLVDAASKNRAAKAALETAQQLGIASPAVTGETKTVWFMDNGQKVDYKVDDPAVLEAINGLQYAGLQGPLWSILTAPKHWLTVGVTASPFFKVRNLIRDSVQAIATSDLSYNIANNVIEGVKLTARDRQEYVSALAGGGLIRFGTMLEGNEAKRTRQLIRKGAKDAAILDSQGAWTKFYTAALEPAIEAYNELGNRGEEINRMSLYNQLIKQGKDHATASLMARDLMDFSLQGSFETIRILSQIVPFFNARMQGMYKLGRATKENRAHMATVIFTAALASLALMGMAAGDEDKWKKWKKREEWDKASNWWFEFGGVQYRIPKPFELGTVSHIMERTVEGMFDKERDAGKRTAKALMDAAMNQLSMNPVPQAFKPIIDLYANYDSFTKRPIETMSMQRLDKDQRYTAQTSMPARALSSTVGGLSPVQYDHLVRAYFGWLGALSVGTADIVARSVNDEPTKPALDYWKFATGGLLQEDQIASRYTSMMYDQAAELEQAHATYNKLRKDGKLDEAKEYREDNKDKLSAYRSVENVKKQVATISERIRMIERSNIHPAEKRIKIRELKQRQSDIASKLSQ